MYGPARRTKRHLICSCQWFLRVVVVFCWLSLVLSLFVCYHWCLFVCCRPWLLSMAISAVCCLILPLLTCWRHLLGIGVGNHRWLSSLVIFDPHRSLWNTVVGFCGFNRFLLCNRRFQALWVKQLVMHGARSDSKRQWFKRENCSEE